MNKGKFVLGTVIGAAAGVVAGMLTAPKSGEETRADLKAKAVELKEEAARRAGSLRAETKDTVERVEDKAENAANEGERIAASAKKDINGK